MTESTASGLAGSAVSCGRAIFREAQDIEYRANICGAAMRQIMLGDNKNISAMVED